MTTDPTQYQSDDARKKARSLSMTPARAPSEVPGYALENFLGKGAYGEVWSAIDLKTSKQVAIKFYTRQTSDDVQLLAQEVEKLVALSTDRYVVQLLDVGWNSTPPYYVMDYLEFGSLEDKLNREGRFTSEVALDIFEDLAQGLMRLHSKGIFHCDLKPANVLLDQDSKPRVADFGQSRLSTEDTGALGTLYYMAPEQADLNAIPDARWDVYGLGAMLYCMLTGAPPFRDRKLTEKIESSEKIGERLKAYRSALSDAPTPIAHRSIPGIDRALADIVDRCIAVEPSKRFTSIQSVVNALRHRETTRAKRPLMLLGILGPLLLLGVMSLFGGWALKQATSDTTQAVRAKANESNSFKARLAARSAAERIDEYFRAVEQLSHDPVFLEKYTTLIRDPELVGFRRAIATPQNNALTISELAKSAPEIIEARAGLMKSVVRAEIEAFLRKRLDNVDHEFPQASSWFVDDRWGNQIASVYPKENRTRLKNYSYRAYFSGLDTDLRDEAGKYLVSDVQAERQIIKLPHLSAIFLSQANNKWKVAFSVPIIIDDQVEGVVAMTVVLGDFIDFENETNQYVMMVDRRAGEFTGTIIEHPLLSKLENEYGLIPKALSQKRIAVEGNLNGLSETNFIDPMGDEKEGTDYRREAIANSAPVELRRKPVTTQVKTVVQPLNGDEGLVSIQTGLEVWAVEDYASVTAPVNSLSHRLMNLLAVALLSLLALTIGMWWFVTRTLGLRTSNSARTSVNAGPNTWSADQETICYEDAHKL